MMSVKFHLLFPPPPPPQFLSAAVSCEGSCRETSGISQEHCVQTASNMSYTMGLDGQVINMDPEFLVSF